MNGYMDGYMDIWMGIWIYGWVYGYMDIWMDIWINSILLPDRFSLPLPEAFSVTCGCQKKCSGRCSCKKLDVICTEFCKFKWSSRHERINDKQCDYLVMSYIFAFYFNLLVKKLYIFHSCTYEEFCLPYRENFLLASRLMRGIMGVQYLITGTFWDPTSL